MPERFSIQYLANTEINLVKWDACIDQSGTDLIYAHSFYLNQMAKHWDALVLNDYEAVMPLTWNRKYGIYYLYQPFLTPQTGIIGKQVSKPMTKAFLSAIPEKFRYIEINLNRSNAIAIPGFNLNSNLAYFLALNTSYEKIAGQFNQNLLRNIKKAVSSGCSYKTGIPLTDILKLATVQLKQYTHLQKEDVSNFKKLCEKLLLQKKATTAGVYRENKLISSCIFFYCGKRIYYILAGNDAAGRKYGASHYLFDQFIREHATRDIVLDFVGSNFHSIAQFYQSFGAKAEQYPSLKINKLPVLLKWAKK